ncbi:MAG: MFS transporter [Gammaproteobacteria bacterium]
MKNKNIIISCTLGNIIQFYDYILFGYFSQLLSQVFFPVSDLYTTKMLGFAVFALGCLMRPIGACLFGYYGDKIGRKKLLILSIAISTGATSLVGLVPTFADIGLWASVVFVSLRILQGFSMSGEETGASVFLAEVVPKTQPGLAGSVILGSVYLGLLAGSLIVLFTSLLLTEHQLVAWGWRIPFLLSILFGTLVVLVRNRQRESQPFLMMQQTGKLAKNPLIEVIAFYKKTTFRCVLACASLAVSAYIFAVYIPTYFNNIFDYHVSMLICGASFLAAFIAVLLVGLWVDKIGYRLPLIASNLSFMIMAPLIFSCLNKQTLSSALVAESLLVVCIGLNAGALMPMLLKQFPLQLRCSGVGIAFNLSMTIFGSTAPLLTLYLSKIFQGTMAPSLYLIFSAALGLSGVLFLERKSLIENISVTI